MGLSSFIKSIFIKTSSIQEFVQSERFIFPEDTDVDCVFTAGAVNNVYSNWAEIIDTGANTLSSKFVAGSGCLSEVATCFYSDTGVVYMFEIAYGAGYTVVARGRFLSPSGALKELIYFVPLRSGVIPAGETVYYRMKCEVALATFCISFRYYYSS